MTKPARPGTPQMRRLAAVDGGTLTGGSHARAASQRLADEPTRTRGLTTLAPFTDALPIPKALAPVKDDDYKSWAMPPGPGAGEQNGTDGRSGISKLRNEAHQIWPNQIGYPDPIVYHIKPEVNQHSFTTSK